MSVFFLYFIWMLLESLQVHKTELLYQVRMTFYPHLGKYDKKWMCNFLVVQFKVRLRFSPWATNNIFGWI